MKSIVAADRLRTGDVLAIQQELVASDQLLDVRPVRRSGRLWTSRSSAPVDHIQRLLDVQRPGLTIGPDAVPIEKSKCGVTRLLDFGDQQAGAERVNGAGGQEHHVACARLEAVQAQVTCAARDLAREARAIEAALEAGIDH